MSAILTECVKSAEGIVGVESTILSSCSRPDHHEEKCFFKIDLRLKRRGECRRDYELR